MNNRINVLAVSQVIDSALKGITIGAAGKHG